MMFSMSVPASSCSAIQNGSGQYLIASDLPLEGSGRTQTIQMTKAIAYILKQQPFYVAGTDTTLGQYRLPLSEGQLDKKYAAVGVQMYLDAVRRLPRLYTIGLGGYEEAFTQMLVKAG